MESDTEMEDFDRSEEGSNWSDDSYLADEDFSFDYQEGVDPHEDALDWEEEDSNESASDSPPRVTPRIESQSESGVNGSESPEETWLPCKGSQSTRTSSVETEEDEGPLLSTLHPDQQRSPSTKTHSPRKRVLASPSLKSKVPRLSTPRKTSRLPHRTESDQPWKTEEDPDEGPQPLRFCPSRPPGPQVDPSAMYSPLDLFQMFFTKVTVRTLCDNTNRQAARNIGRGKKFKWIDITVKEFYKFIGLVFFTALVKTRAISDYWITNSIFSIPLWQTKAREALQDESAANSARNRDTPKTLPGSAMSVVYHSVSFQTEIAFMIGTTLKEWPQLSISLLTLDIKTEEDEAPPLLIALPSEQQCSPSEPLAEEHYALTEGTLKEKSWSTEKDHDEGSAPLNFSPDRCPGVQLNASATVLSWNIHTSDPDEDAVNDHRKGTPEYDGLFRLKPLLNDIRHACLSYYHPQKNLSVHKRSVASKCMVSNLRAHEHFKEKLTKVGFKLFVLTDSSNGYTVDYIELISCYSANRKTFKWYRSLFFLFVDIATTNSFLIHKDLCKGNKVQPVPHKDFMENLTAQLCEVPLEIPTRRGKTGHMPIRIKVTDNISRMATFGRRHCENCKKTRGYLQTPWICNEYQDVTIVEFYKCIGLVLFIGQLKLRKIVDYWKDLNLFSVLFPTTFMSRDR
ncbi:unnamed protein product [Coregonus sp. 'balchen']|nr:unnamed protein product [Coregonus sp. 'balchen']